MFHMYLEPTSATERRYKVFGTNTNLRSLDGPGHWRLQCTVASSIAFVDYESFCLDFSSILNCFLVF